MEGLLAFEGEDGNVRGLEPGGGGDVAVFTAQVAGLARGRVGGIARRHFAADVGIQVCEGCGAVAICWDGLVVDVVHWW